MSAAHRRDVAQDVPDHPSPPIVPSSLNEREADLLALMIQRIQALKPRSGADALRALRDAFPESPLTLRVAALNLTMRARKS